MDLVLPSTNCAPIPGNAVLKRRWPRGRESTMPISPNQGSMGGGTTVTITGVNLSGATAVNFGGKNATITANTPTAVTVISPSGSGLAPINVTTQGGASNDLPFYYVPGPTVISLSPTAGTTTGGNTVSITGVNLSSATSVQVGS